MNGWIFLKSLVLALYFHFTTMANIIDPSVSCFSNTWTNLGPGFFLFLRKWPLDWSDQISKETGGRFYRLRFWVWFWSCVLTKSKSKFHNSKNTRQEGWGGVMTIRCQTSKKYFCEPLSPPPHPNTLTQTHSGGNPPTFHNFYKNDPNSFNFMQFSAKFDFIFPPPLIYYHPSNLYEFNYGCQPLPLKRPPPPQQLELGEYVAGPQKIFIILRYCAAWETRA